MGTCRVSATDNKSKLEGHDGEEVGNNDADDVDDIPRPAAAIAMPHRSRVRAKCTHKDGTKIKILRGVKR